MSLYFPYYIFSSPKKGMKVKKTLIFDQCWEGCSANPSWGKLFFIWNLIYEWTGSTLIAFLAVWWVSFSGLPFTVFGVWAAFGLVVGGFGLFGWWLCPSLSWRNLYTWSVCRRHFSKINYKCRLHSLSGITSFFQNKKCRAYRGSLPKK